MEYLCLQPGCRFADDPPYHPDERVEICLSSELVEELFVELSEQFKVHEDLLKVIRMREHLHRQAVTGSISTEQENENSNELYEQYVKSFKCWPHQETYYNEFYRKLNDGNWS